MDDRMAAGSTSAEREVALATAAARRSESDYQRAANAGKDTIANFEARRRKNGGSTSWVEHKNEVRKSMLRANREEARAKTTLAALDRAAILLAEAARLRGQCSTLPDRDELVRLYGKEQAAQDLGSIVLRTIQNCETSPALTRGRGEQARGAAQSAARDLLGADSNTSEMARRAGEALLAEATLRVIQEELLGLADRCPELAEIIDEGPEIAA